MEVAYGFRIRRVVRRIRFLWQVGKGLQPVHSARVAFVRLRKDRYGWHQP